MINRVQSVNNNGSYRQNFRGLTSEVDGGLAVLEDAMKFLPQPQEVASRPVEGLHNLLSSEYVLAAKNAFAKARRMVTDLVITEQKFDDGVRRFYLEVSAADGSNRIVHLATMSSRDNAAQKVVNVRQFLDTFTSTVEQAHAIENAAN